MVNGPDKVSTSAEGVVHHNRNSFFMRQLRDFLQIRHVVARIADAFEVNRLGVVIDGSNELFRVVTIHELAVDAQPRKHDLELVVGTPVQIGRRDDVVPSLSKSSNGHELSSLARRSGNSCNTALESGHAFLKHIDSGLVGSAASASGRPHESLGSQPPTYVHNTAVDIAKLLQPKQPGAMGRVVEYIALLTHVSSLLPAISDTRRVIPWWHK